ncbi:MAG: hypothetical protein J0M26_10000 [Planctomycetes bacterium]|nr:hypothetical protein [Planctomycetota bacterium]
MDLIEAVVLNGKIEINAPPSLEDGEKVSLMVLNHKRTDELLTQEEITKVLEILDALCQPSLDHREGKEEGSELHVSDEWEKGQFANYAEKLKGLFE